VPHSRPVLGVPTPDGLEAQARKDLAAGRWRQARDAFKQLCKRDPATFQPLVIESNLGLARAMLGKRQISEARQVLAYLETFAPPEAVAGLEAEIGACADTLPTPPVDSVALLAEGSRPPTERRRYADELVADFGRAGIDAGTPARAQVAADLLAIHQGLEAACLGDHERALELVRPLKRDSAFAHWRLFVRAVVAFQRNDAEKAAQYFEELPVDSAPGRARAAWLLALGKPAGASAVVAEIVVEAAASLSGHPGWGRVLARADALWRAGKHEASYRVLRDWKTSFPSEGIDLAGVLSDFYFNSVFVLPETDRMAYEDHLQEITEGGRGKRPTELMLARRTLCLLMMGSSDDFPPTELRPMWEAFLRDHERAHGANPRRASLAWCRLGEVLARTRPKPLFGRGAPAFSDTPGAIVALEKSIALDPANASAHLLLAPVYKAARRVRDRNRLLDVMTVRFPNDKDVLLAAAAGCIDRKALVKAVEYFERALALDRLDPATPNYLVEACVRLARQHYEKRHPREGRAILDRAGELAVEAPDNFVRGRWCVATRRGVLEQIYGDAANGAELLDQARTISPSAAAFAFFARLAWSAYGRDKAAPAALKTEWERSAMECPSAAEATALVQLLVYWASAPNMRIGAEESWLRRYLKRAAKNPFTRDEAALLLEHLRKLPNLEREALVFASAALKRDRADPLFRLYKELLQPFPMLDRPQCEAILDEARRRGDAPAEQLAHEVMASQSMLPRIGGVPWDDEFEDIDEDLDDGESGPDSFNGVHVLGVPSEEVDEGIAAFVAMLAILPPSAVAALRKKLPKGMSAELFDALLSIAKSGTPRLEVPRARLPRRKSKGKRPSRSENHNTGDEPTPAFARDPAVPQRKPPVPAVPQRKLPVPSDPAQADLF